MQGDLFDPPPRPRRKARKRIADTSRESYDQIRPELPARCLKTRAALAEYIAAFRRHPTSGELTEWLQRQGRAFDVNSVRPVLTWLKDSGNVRVVGRRRCGYSGRTAWVWDVA